MTPCPPSLPATRPAADLKPPFVARVGWLLVPPLLVTLMCLGHGLYCYALLTGLLPEQLLTGLAYVPGTAVARAARLQELQLVVVGGGLAGFVACWAFLLLRNQLVLRECRREAVPGPVQYRHRSRPVLLALLRPGLAGVPGAGCWLLPAWWALLLAATGCAATGLLRMNAPDLTVGAWRVADYWLLAAHGLFLVLFQLSRRLVPSLEGLRCAWWQYRNAAVSGRSRPAGMALRPGAG